ncbi:unnamed protein product, partial [Meganyctiphanes norvegica]
QVEKVQIKSIKSQNKEKVIENSKEQPNPRSDQQKHASKSPCLIDNVSMGNDNINLTQIKDLSKLREKESQENVAHTLRDIQSVSISEKETENNNISNDQVQEQMKVIHNELLCYLVHIRPTVPKEEIVEIISKFYEERFILEAYEVLCSCLPETLQRNIKKIKEIDSKEMVASMYEWLDIIKSDKLPEFGCLVLSRLPATLLKDVDSVTLYMNQLGIKREIGDTKQELKELKMQFSSEVQELKVQFVSEIASIKNMLIKQAECSSTMSPIRDIFELCPNRKYSEVAMLSTPSDSRESTVTRDSQSSSGVSTSSLASSSSLSINSYQSLSNTASNLSSNNKCIGLSQTLPSAESNIVPWNKIPSPYFSTNQYEERIGPINAAKAYQKNRSDNEELLSPSTDESVDGFIVVRSKKNKQKYKKSDRSWIIDEK